MASTRPKPIETLPNAEVRAALINAALAARHEAYARYSHFGVGAALLAADGSTYRGCNVENASYGLTICAERAAVFSAVAAGRRQFQALAVASQGGVTPCGACRQVLAEFAPNLEIWLVDVDRPNEWVLWSLADLLPGTFTLPLPPIDAQQPDAQQADAQQPESRPRVRRKSSKR